MRIWEERRGRIRCCLGAGWVVEDWCCQGRGGAGFGGWAVFSQVPESGLGHILFICILVTPGGSALRRFDWMYQFCVPFFSECVNASPILFNHLTQLHFQIFRAWQWLSPNTITLLHASDTNPASHEFLRNSLSFVHKTQFEQELYTSTDAGLQRRRDLSMVSIRDIRLS